MGRVMEEDSFNFCTMQLSVKNSYAYPLRTFPDSRVGKPNFDALRFAHGASNSPRTACLCILMRQRSYIPSPISSGQVLVCYYNTPKAQNFLHRFRYDPLNKDVPIGFCLQTINESCLLQSINKDESLERGSQPTAEGVMCEKPALPTLTSGQNAMEQNQRTAADAVLPLGWQLNLTIICP